MELSEQYILGWGTLALINGALANIGGRSPLAYLVGSLLFGPLLTFFLATTKFDPEKGTTFVNLVHGVSGRPAPSTKLPNWLVAIIFIGFVTLFAVTIFN